METSGLTVAPGNQAQAQAWDGDEGSVWASYPEFFDDSTRPHHEALMKAAAIGHSDRVLDIGCGTGGSTIAAAQAASHGTAVGIDLSARMLEQARHLAERQGVQNATFIHADAQVYPYDPETFNIAISRTGAMFFADQVAAFGNIATALRPGGRLALVSWQAPTRNEWFHSFVEALTLGRAPRLPPPDAPSPFAHSDPERVVDILTSAGFKAVRTDPLELPMRFGATADEAHEVLRQLLGWMTRDQGQDERESAFANLRKSLETHQTADGVIYRSAVWVITATRG
jgi:SAM-dependent methyltransferase